MKLLKTQTNSIWRLNVLVAVFVFFIFATMSQATFAHKGHGGSMKIFMKDKAALKMILPSGAKIVKRKQRLNDQASEWAEKTYNVDLDNNVHVYYLASDKVSKAPLGGAMIIKMSYRHGDVSLAIGVDDQGLITKVFVLAVSDKYIPDIEGTIGLGHVPLFDGKKIDQLVIDEDADKPTRDATKIIRETAALLNAFIKSEKDKHPASHDMSSSAHGH